MYIKLNLRTQDIVILKRIRISNKIKHNTQSMNTNVFSSIESNHFNLLSIPFLSNI